MNREHLREAFRLLAQDVQRVAGVVGQVDAGLPVDVTEDEVPHHVVHVELVRAQAVHHEEAHADSLAAVVAVHGLDAHCHGVAVHAFCDVLGVPLGREALPVPGDRLAVAAAELRHRLERATAAGQDVADHVVDLLVRNQDVIFTVHGAHAGEGMEFAFFVCQLDHRLVGAFACMFHGGEFHVAERVAVDNCVWHNSTSLIARENV